MAGRTCIFDGCAVGLSRNFNPLAPFSVVLPMSVPSLPSFCQSFTALNSTGLRRRARASDYSRSWSDQEQKSTGRVCSVCSRTHPACRCRSILDRGQQHADKSARSVCKDTGYGKHNMRTRQKEIRRCAAPSAPRPRCSALPWQFGHCTRRIDGLFVSVRLKSQAAHSFSRSRASNCLSSATAWREAGEGNECKLSRL